MVPLVPPPPLQSPPVARDGLPWGGGGRSPSDGLWGGEGELQGDLKAPQQWPTHVHQVYLSGTIPGHREKTSFLSLKKQHDTEYTTFEERISQNTHG